MPAVPKPCAEVHIGKLQEDHTQRWRVTDCWRRCAVHIQKERELEMAHGNLGDYFKDFEVITLKVRERDGERERLNLPSCPSH